MNIEVKDISDTRKGLVITLDPAEVDAEYQAVLSEFARVAKIPGFRPGKVPAEMLARRFERQIADELRQKVLSRAYRGAAEEKKLPILTVVKLEPGTIAPGTPATLDLLVDIRPEFPLPDYQGLPVKDESVEPTEEEVDAVITRLRTESADFTPAERPAQKGDFVKLSYEGTLEGKPIAELAPEQKIYGTVPQTWEEVEGEHEGVLPGLGTRLSGIQVGETRTVPISFPANFTSVPELAGKTASYDVKALEIRERALPPLDEKFFKSHQVDDLDGLKAQVRSNLKMQKDYQNRAAQRRQVTDGLAAKVEFPVPQSLVDQETQDILRRFLEENLRRGVPQEQFEKDKKQLIEGARQAATNRVKLQLILARIAEAEKITATEQDFDNYIYHQAARSGQKPEKLARELSRNRDHLRAAQQAIIHDKTVDFLVSRATVAPAGQPA